MLYTVLKIPGGKIVELQGKIIAYDIKIELRSGLSPTTNVKKRPFQIMLVYPQFDCRVDHISENVRVLSVGILRLLKYRSKVEIARGNFTAK